VKLRLHLSHKRMRIRSLKIQFHFVFSAFFAVESLLQVEPVATLAYRVPWNS